jgi:aminotransferase in exopolysaccharide biosynthesis
MEKKFEQIVKFVRELYKQPESFIPLHAPVFHGNEKKYLNECIDTTFVSAVGKFVDKFEEEIAHFTGASKAVSCVNGTNALHLALKLVGVDNNTEVITQPLTFIATANAISYCGANPIFLDVDIDTMGLSPNSLRKWLEENALRTTPGKQPINKTTRKRISACVPMHTFGHPCRIDQIVEICDEYNIPVVEDSAESLGSYYKGKHTGLFGRIGVLSFNGNKVLTTGGGGMLLFTDELLAAKAKHLTTQAKIPHPWEFTHDSIGYNYRMPNINAALGLAQLEQLPLFLQSKRTIADAYKSFFLQLGIKFFEEPTNSISNYWLNAILFDNKEERNAFLKFSNENKVMTRPAWTLMNELEMFKGCETDKLINANAIASTLVNIPSSPII